MLGSLRRVTEVDRPTVVAPVTAGHGVNEFFSIVIPPIIPLLVSDLGITYGQAGVLVTVFFVMYSIFQLPAGIVADWVGKKRMFVAGLLGMSAGIVLATAAPTYEVLLLAQTVAGIGGSTVHPTGMSLISDVEGSETEGKAMGVFGFGGALGTMSSPLVVGGLAAVAGWRVALAGALVVGFAVTVYIMRVFPDDEPGTTRATRADGGRPTSVGETIRAAKGVLDVPLTRGIVLLFFVTLVLSMQHRAIQTYTTSYITAETGTSATIGNVAFFALLVGGSLSSLWAGDLADRFDRKRLGIAASVATAVLVAATLLVTPLVDGVPFGLLLAVLVVWFSIIGVMMYASYPVKNALVSEHAEATSSGGLFGVIQTGSALGSASGPALFGALSTQWGIVAAFPAIAGVSVVLAALFVALMVID
ncbi:Predicted arabinose efflux permease, MFS family [Natronorubrum sediminis]|uniref:Predicted arabinose efflux permease, MFS family n=1 Tax=Natronorubrum sediminis TaxID=640943 RepID=A0A1H6FUH0_9EURY|nr:MFS transporter [Natronorubrum sediminis]SEH13494.1 Predicted arabinose efflux permease, MFS family [Natronorubrum sediminis]